MDEATARTRLTAMLGGDARPTLSDDEVTALLDSYRLADSDGRAPGDEGWTGNWALNAAAAEGWRWKSAKVAGDFTFSADDASYNKGDVLANCERMVAQFAALDNGVIDVSTTDPSTYRVDRLWL